VTARKLKWQEAKMGLAGPSRTAVDEEMDSEVAGKHTFAPRDTKLVVYQSKDDREGLGFQKGMGMGKLPQRGRAGPCEFAAGLLVSSATDTDNKLSVSDTAMMMMTMTIHMSRRAPHRPHWLSRSIMEPSKTTM
jgi:hypothetical protein